MVKKIEQNNQQLYQCEACSYLYESEDIAKQCQTWCTEHQSCNLDITKYAVKTGDANV